jgi:hypothetical protein
MTQYLVAIHHPDNYDPSTEDEAMVRDIDVLNGEMVAAGARFFAGGLQSAPHAKSLRMQAGGDVVITDGPYLETKEHIGGFWILDAANMDEAVAWGRKAVLACRASVEVREFLALPGRPIDWMMPASVSAMRGVGLPSLGSRQMVLATSAPSRLRSMTSLYSQENAPDAGCTGFCSVISPILTERSTIPPPPAC